jgi:hypothetical protein
MIGIHHQKDEKKRKGWACFTTKENAFEEKGRVVVAVIEKLDDAHAEFWWRFAEDAADFGLGIRRLDFLGLLFLERWMCAEQWCQSFLHPVEKREK